MGSLCRAYSRAPDHQKLRTSGRRNVVLDYHKGKHALAPTCKRLCVCIYPLVSSECHRTALDSVYSYDEFIQSTYCEPICLRVHTQGNVWWGKVWRLAAFYVPMWYTLTHARTISIPFHKKLNTLVPAGFRICLV